VQESGVVGAWCSRPATQLSNGVSNHGHAEHEEGSGTRQRRSRQTRAGHQPGRQVPGHGQRAGAAPDGSADRLGEAVDPAGGGCHGHLRGQAERAADAAREEGDPPSQAERRRERRCERRRCCRTRQRRRGRGRRRQRRRMIACGTSTRFFSAGAGRQLPAHFLSLPLTATERG